MDAAVEDRLKAAIEAGSIDALQQFLDYFDRQPSAAAARGELIARLKGAGRWLEAELLGKQGPEAHGPDAAGGQRLLPGETVWPMGNVEIASRRTRNAAVNPGVQIPVELRGKSEPLFSDLQLASDASGQLTVVGRNGWGKEQWRVNLPHDNNYYHQTWTHARADGHLLLVLLGWKVVAIDGLGSGSDGAPRLLWSRNLIGPETDSSDCSRPCPAASSKWACRGSNSSLSIRGMAGRGRWDP